ncbi:DUF4837 family protein [Salisaeta longa]|uniref:DUF4837 family protein n=1 Tax=Salisaeta longa TaxID=503170 RepID=UPI0003B4BB08|nr:DUF4837 family protein [Salisaeta longa]
MSARYTLAATAALWIVLLLGGCIDGDYRPRATGPEGQITVVMDSARWKGPVGEAFRKYVTPYRETLPLPERMFTPYQIDLSSEQTYERITEQKNIVIIAPLSDSTNEANFLRRRLSEDVRQAVMNGQTVVVPKPNLWRRSQRVYFITAATQEGLINALQNNGKQIRQTFRQITLERMQNEMFERARQYDIEDSLMQKHGFAVHVQHDYVIAVDTMTDSTGFIWLRRLLTETRRDLLLYYKENADPSVLSPQWVYDTRDSLTRKYMRGSVRGFVKIDYRRPLETDQTSFLGRYAYLTEGLWHMVAPMPETGELMPVGGGGPFVNYTFYDQATDRIYMIDGSVFAPKYDKLRFIRQMEVIAQTFRTKAEVSDAPATAAQ